MYLKMYVNYLYAGEVGLYDGEVGEYAGLQ
jgi:hypothetical protein